MEKKAPHMIPTTVSLNELKQSTDSYLKTVDVLKAQIEELTENKRAEKLSSSNSCRNE